MPSPLQAGTTAATRGTRQARASRSQLGRGPPGPLISLPSRHTRDQGGSRLALGFEGPRPSTFYTRGVGWGTVEGTAGPTWGPRQPRPPRQMHRNPQTSQQTPGALHVPLSISGPAHRTGAVKGIWGMRGPGVCSLPPTGRKQPRGRAEAARRPRSSDGRPTPAASASHIATPTRHEGGRRTLRVLGHQCSWRRPPVLSPPENPG